jgi:hypothetical protein
VRVIWSIAAPIEPVRAISSMIEENAGLATACWVRVIWSIAAPIEPVRAISSMIEENAGDANLAESSVMRAISAEASGTLERYRLASAISLMSRATYVPR